MRGISGATPSMNGSAVSNTVRDGRLYPASVVSFEKMHVVYDRFAANRRSKLRLSKGACCDQFWIRCNEPK